jgi:hypothetical protein
MSKGQFDAVGGQRGPESGFIPPENVMVVEIDDVAHPKHKFYTKRLDPEREDNRQLIESMCLIGWKTGSLVWLYRDGPNVCVAAGRRRITAACVANERRKAERKPPIKVPFMFTTDPATAERIENAGRVNLPPLQLARDFIDAREEYDGDESKAAAVVGVSLALAHQLEACLSLPPDIRRKVNDLEIAVDVAARMAKGGTETARKVVSESTDANGKVDGKRARKAATDATKRPRMRTARVAGSVADELQRTSEGAEDIEAAEKRGALVALAWARNEERDFPSWFVKAVESAEGARKAAGT